MILFSFVCLKVIYLNCGLIQGECAEMHFLVLSQGRREGPHF